MTMKKILKTKTAQEPTIKAENLTPNIVKAVYEFLSVFAVPEIKKENIFYGNQNNIALPAESNDYVIFSYISSVRHGTGFEEYDEKGLDDEIYLSNTVEVLVQVDCYASTKNGEDGINAMLRAQALDTVARSSVGVQFFKDRGLSLLYADDPKDTTLVGDSDSYVKRSTLTLHLSMQSVVKATMGFFSAVNVDLKNVDVSYPPKEDKK